MLKTCQKNGLKIDELKTHHISRSLSHGTQHKLLSLENQGVCLIDLGTSFQAWHKLMLISFTLPDT